MLIVNPFAYPFIQFLSNLLVFGGCFSVPIDEFIKHIVVDLEVEKKIDK